MPKTKLKPSILFILHLPPPVHGAALMGKFIKDSSLINEAFHCKFINLSTADSLDDIGKGSFVKIFKLLNLQYRLIRTLQREKIDLCYMTLTAKGAGFYKDFLIVFIVKLFQKNIIFHFHNKGVNKRQDKIFDNVLYEFVFKNSKVILLSKRLYADIQKYVKQKDIYYCQNGIPVSIDAHSLSYLDHNTIPDIRILFLSNMMQEKGVMELLKACKLLKERGVPFYCDFVGAWSDITEHKFQEIVLNYGLTTVVSAHGKKFDTDKALFLKNADIFVFPTYYHNECFPLVLLEALQYGLPVISTDEGAIQDIIENNINGFIISARDADAIADKIEFLFQNPDVRFAMGKAGRKKFDTCFTVMKFERELTNIISKVVQKE